MKGTVISVSKNTNSFGYKGVIVMNQEGECIEVLVQAYGTDVVPSKGEDVDTSQSKFSSSYVFRSVLPSVAKQIIRKTKDEANKT